VCQSASETQFWVSGFRVLCSRTAFCALSRWAWCPPCVPQDELMLDHLHTLRNFIATLLLPVGWWLNTLAIWR